MHSCDKQVKLLGERWLPIAGVVRLLFAHHVDHLDPAEDHTGGVDRLEPEHRSDPPLDSPMILLNSIIQVAALPDPDWLEPAP